MLLAGAAFLTGLPRALLWTAAVAIDYAGPAWLTRERLRGLQQVSVVALRRALRTVRDHLPGRVGGRPRGRGGYRHRPLTAELVFGATLALLITIGLWWTYFDRVAERAQDAAARARRPGAGRRRRLQLHPPGDRGRESSSSTAASSWWCTTRRSRRCPDPGGWPCAAAWPSTCSAWPAFRLRMFGELSSASVDRGRGAAGAVRARRLDPGLDGGRRPSPRWSARWGRSSRCTRRPGRWRRRMRRWRREHPGAWTRPRSARTRPAASAIRCRARCCC